MSLFHWAEELSPVDSVGVAGVHISNTQLRDSTIAEKKNSALLESSGLKPWSIRTRTNLQSARAISLCSSLPACSVLPLQQVHWKE